MKRKPQNIPTCYKVNKGIIGHTIEITMERLINEGAIEQIDDRDLVYNDNEVNIVNPITNIRSDKFELMLEEKIDMYNHRHKKVQTENEPSQQENDSEENAA